MKPYFERAGIAIHQGDCLDTLCQLPSGIARTCVTSPPYWGLRDYGADGQIGLEASPSAFIEKIVEVFREVRRVLTDDGTLWLNIGDSYATHWNTGHGWESSGLTKPNGRERKIQQAQGASTRKGRSFDGLANKNMMLIPARVAIALQDDGWIVRQDIIWHKSNPMPESVRDRCTKAHEYLFLLAKSERYFFDADAIAEPRVSQHAAPVAGWAAGDSSHSPIAHARDKGNARTFRGGQYVNGSKFKNDNVTERESHGNAPAESTTRNPRSVWTIATQPFRGAHFATFPEKLVEPCIRAGSEPGDVVLDPFAGSGTTAVVAQREGREFIGCELNAAYIDLAAQRLAQEVLPFA